MKKVIFFAIVASLFYAGAAFGAWDPTTAEDTIKAAKDPIMSYGGATLVPLAGIWVVRKFIKTTNRS